MSAINTIKQALSDKDKRIKELENKLNAIKEVYKEYQNENGSDYDYIGIEIEKLLRSDDSE